MERRQYMTWLVALSLLLGLALGAAACSSQPQPGTGGEAATSGETVAEEAAPGEGEAAEGEAVAMAGDPAAGEEVFTKTCSACHGPDAHGIEGLGKDLHSNEFLAAMTDEEALAFLKVGRPAGDPLNTTGVDMPPKGGNPALDDEDLLNVVAYVRSLK